MKIEILKHEQFGQIRMQHIDGEAWFVAKDITTSIGIKEPYNSVKELDQDEKGLFLIRTLGGDQKMWHVNESGLYGLIFQSRKAEAKKFRKWVTSQVLPSIRKTGKYQVGGATPANIHAVIDMNAASRLMYEIAMLEDDAKRKTLAAYAQKAISSVSVKRVEQPQ